MNPPYVFVMNARPLRELVYVEKSRVPYPPPPHRCDDYHINDLHRVRAVELSAQVAPVVELIKS